MSHWVRTTIEGTRFLHRELWRVVSRQIDRRNENPVGAFYDDLVAMIFAFHTLEAYLNFVGEHLAPDIWRKEREFFATPPYRGFDGKIRKVFELAGISEPDRRARPYSTVWLLKDFRDTIAHARPEKFGSTVEHLNDVEPSWHSTPMDTVVTKQNADYSQNDIAAVIEMIHAAARLEVNDIWFGPVALSGPLQYSSGSSALAP